MPDDSIDTTALTQVVIHFSMHARSLQDKQVLDAARSSLEVLKALNAELEPEALFNLGCQKIHWSPERADGGYFEYYLPVRGSGRGSNDLRLSVIFGEGPQVGEPPAPYMCRLVTSKLRVSLPGVRTVQQFIRAYVALTGQPLTIPLPSRSIHKRKVAP